MADKGGSFERDVCRVLSIWWTKGQADDVIWRNRTRRQTGARQAENQLGDICACKEAGILLTETISFECKSGYSAKKSPTKKTKEKRSQVKEKVKNIPWDLLDNIDGKADNSIIINFWNQTKQAADRVNKIPVLIFKRDYHTPVICIDDSFLCKLEEHMWPQNNLEYLSKITLKIEGCPILHFFRMEAFLLSINPDIILQIREERKK